MTDYDPTRGIPRAELAVLRKLGKAEITFCEQVREMANDDTLTREPGAPRAINFDDPMLAHVTEIYRQAVEEAAGQGVECAQSWYALAIWTKKGKERIGYFSRALDCIESRDREDDLRVDLDVREVREYSDAYLRAECLFGIGRVHALEGNPSVAREFLLRALPFAQEAERLAIAGGATGENRLEGRIAALLVQLPDEADESRESPE